MYRDKTYRVRSISEIEDDLRQASNYYHRLGLRPEKIFLCDGDALGAPMELLENTLDLIHELFPDVRRIGVYATAENILLKTENELKRLSERRLSIAYLGLESGDDKVLHKIVKGNTAQDMLEASLKIKRCGFQLSTIVMLGVGGVEHSEDHVRQTASILGQTSPHFLSFLTTFAIEKTPYYTMVNRGLITPLSTKQLLTEFYSIIEQSQFNHNNVIFRANHVSNAIPIGGILPKDTQKILHTLREWMDRTPESEYPVKPSSM